MNEEAFEHPVYEKNVIEFVTVVNEYCGFVEKADSFSKRNFISKAQKLLPLLYLKASLLPDVESMQDEENEKFVTEGDYHMIYHTIHEKLGEDDDYLEVFDPMMQESEGPIPQSIAENFSDIYQDIKDFVMVYRVGTIEVMNDALWELNMGFANDWGQKLVNVIRAIHMVQFKKDDESDAQGNTSKYDDIDPDTVNTDDYLISKIMRNYSNNDEQ